MIDIRSNHLSVKETAAHRILSLVAVVGELPVNQLIRLSGGKAYKENIIKSLKAKGLLRTHYADGARGYRLTARAKKMLLEQNPKRFSSVLSGAVETNHIKSEIARRVRLHRIAETIVTMQNAGVSFYADDKADIFSRSGLACERIVTPSFYNSREIKAMGTAAVKIHGARSVGVLLTDTGVYVTYNLGGSLMKWSYKAEMRTKALMQTMLCLERLPEMYSSDDIHGLLFGSDMSLAAEILACKSENQYMLIDGSYDHFHYLTNDRKGERILRLLCSGDLKTRLDGILLDDLYESGGSLTVENDAVDKQGAPVLLAYTCDLPRIKRFDTALSLQNKSGTIICFDFQKETLRRVCGENVRFQTIDFEKWERSFFEPS